MYQKALVIIGIIGVCLSLVLGVLSYITWQVVAVLIAVFFGAPSLILTYEKLKPDTEKKGQEQKKTSPTGFVTLSPKEEKEVPERRETIVVNPRESYFYEFDLLRGDRVKGEISSTSRLDIYFLDEMNFDKWYRDKYPEPADSNESVLETDIDYEATKRGTWYVTIENNGRKSATVKVNLSVVEGDLSSRGYVSPS